MKLRFLMEQLPEQPLEQEQNTEEASGSEVVSPGVGYGCLGWCGRQTDPEKENILRGSGYPLIVV